MKCSELCNRFNERLHTAEYASIDASQNGLQVGTTDQAVDRVAFAVDGALETIERASEFGADVLVVHHGLLWGGDGHITGLRYRRVRALLEADMSLYAVHLPLDGHQELGNAAGIADLLDLQNRSPFGEIDGRYIGQSGDFADARDIDSVAQKLDEGLDTGGSNVEVLEFGSEMVSNIAIVTGSGTDWIDEAAETGVDALVTGEGKQQVYHRAREHGINVILAGHYATETYGVQALQDIADEWGLDTTFIQCPTGL